MRDDKYSYYEKALDYSQTNERKARNRKQAKEFYEAAWKKMNKMISPFAMLHL